MGWLKKAVDKVKSVVTGQAKNFLVNNPAAYISRAFQGEKIVVNQKDYTWNEALKVYVETGAVGAAIATGAGSLAGGGSSVVSGGKGADLLKGLTSGSIVSSQNGTTNPADNQPAAAEPEQESDDTSTFIFIGLGVFALVFIIIIAKS